MCFGDLSESHFHSIKLMVIMHSMTVHFLGKLRFDGAGATVGAYLPFVPGVTRFHIF